MRATSLIFPWLGALALAGRAPAQEAPDPFPPASPAEQGVDPAALERLDALVAGFVERDEVVGAELLVVKSRRSVLHSVHGWADREEQRAMQPDTLFCVRSMTKPVTGTAVRMLIAEGLLDTDDRLAELWSAFETPTCETITVEHLLTHASGFPLSLLLGKDLEGIDDVEDVALLGVDCELEFPPGERFGYSDQNSDTLGALVQRLSGVPFEDFVRERILEPLGMRGSLCVMAMDEPLRARTASSYFGTKGDWTRFWSPADETHFPCFLGSQGLYATPKDYALFLEMWMRKGRGRDGRLLSSRSVRQALEPAREAVGVGLGFDTLESWYGQQWQLWLRERAPEAEGEAPEHELVAFGHGGSDGTWAWAFPEQDLMVLYFTQSRGNATGLELEGELERSFLGAPFDPNALAPPLEPYLGCYFDERAERYAALILRDGALWLEAPARGLLELRYAGDETWKLELSATTGLSFRRDDQGRIDGLWIHEGGADVLLTRLEPAADLPDGAAVLERARAVHGLERLAQVGGVRLRGRFDFTKLDRHGTAEVLLAPGGRFRVDVDVGGELESTIVAGGRALTRSSRTGASELEGRRLRQALVAGWLGRFGDPADLGLVGRTLYRTELDEEPALVVRLGPPHDLAITRYYGAESGKLLREHAVLLTPGLGEIGVATRFSDWRDVEGLLLPMRTELEFPGPTLGGAVLQVEEVETGVEPAADAFDLDVAAAAAGDGG